MKKIFVVGFAALLLVAFTVPAMAKVDVGGIVFTDFYYQKQDAQNHSGFTVPPAVPADSSWSQSVIEVPSITRLKAKWTNENGVGMFIEFGIGGGQGATGVSLRHAYGWWDVNPGFTLMVGHSTTPFSPLTPDQLLGTQSGGLHVIGIGYGEFYSGRFPQIRGTFNINKNARIAIALVSPVVTASPFTDRNGNLPPTAAVPSPNFIGDNDSAMPRIDVGVPLYFGNVKIYPSFFYHSQSYDDGGVGQDNSIDAYGVSFGITGGFGPVGIKAEVNYGENWGNTRRTGGVSPADAMAGAQVVAGKVYDTECTSYFIDVSFKLGMATPHLIYGNLSTENSDAPLAANDWDFSTTMYGISIPIPVAKTFIIRPEFMIYDDGDSNKIGGVTRDYGKETLLGVQFMIAF